MASPFTWSKVTPADTDIVSAFPALARARQVTLGDSATGGVLGTLVPTGTPTSGFRVVQDTDEVSLAASAFFNGTAWVFDNASTNKAYRMLMSQANDYFSWQRAPVSANPPVWTELMRLGATFLSLGTNPAASGIIRLPNATTIEQRNAANSSDLQVAGYTAGNVLQIGDAGAAAVESEQLLRPGTAGLDLGTSSLLWRNLFISGTIQNATATMGLAIRKGTGLGNYTTNSATFVRVDSTNLAFPVTVPTGWKLWVVAHCEVFSTAAATNWVLALADGTADNTGILVQQTIQESGGRASVSLGWVLTGDGASHTINLQWHAGGSTENMDNSSSTSIPTMEFLLMPSN